MVLRAICDPVRWHIVRLLCKGPVRHAALAEHLGVSAAVLSRHIRILREAGLVTSYKEGKFCVSDLVPQIKDLVLRSLPFKDLSI